MHHYLFLFNHLNDLYIYLYSEWVGLILETVSLTWNWFKVDQKMLDCVFIRKIRSMFMMRTMYRTWLNKPWPDTQWGFPLIMSTGIDTFYWVDTGTINSIVSKHRFEKWIQWSNHKMISVHIFVQAGVDTVCRQACVGPKSEHQDRGKVKRNWFRLLRLMGSGGRLRLRSVALWMEWSGSRYWEAEA